VSTVLHNILQFTGLTVGVPVSLPHKLNRNGVPAVPKIGATNAGGFTVTADAVNVTVTRLAAGGAAVNVYVEIWHSIEDAEPPGGLDSLIPFIIESSVGAGGGTPSGPPTAVAFFDAGGLLTGDAAKFYLDLATKDVYIGGANGTARIFVNQSASFNSNAGLQHSSDVANRAQYRGNQFGNNAGVPGVTGFKSRGTIGVLGGVLAGDVLWRATAIGVAPNNIDIPLAGTISINAANPVPPGGNYVPTDFEVALVPLAGPINSRRPVFLVDSEGVLHVKEGANAMAGVAVTGAGGTVVVANTRITASTRITLTVQDGGAANGLYVSGRVVGASFTIQMIAAGDVGVQVYYQLYEPIP